MIQVAFFSPCTHYQDEEVLSNTEVEDSNDIQIDKESDSDGEADSDKPRRARDTVTVVTNSDVSFEFFKKNKNLDSKTVVKLYDDTSGTRFYWHMTTMEAKFQILQVFY